MAETIPDLRGLPKSRAYSELAGHTDAVLEGVDDVVTAMATISSLVHHAFGHLWTGFYRVVVPGQLLRVGPYQGTLDASILRSVRECVGRRRRRCEPWWFPMSRNFPVM
jgi:GAF domain-containing protein